ncbi:MAG: dihydrofolate reductase family protein [Gaiellaceae bacterium]
MRKLVESTFMTLDGVISRPQDWSPPYWDDEHTAYAGKLLDPADALLLGRDTYEAFAAAWPGRPGEYADKINSMPKHVASRTLTETTWNASLIEGDVAEAVAALKEQDGGDIIKYGTGELDRALVENQLVDEFHFWVFPVVAGKGDRLFDGLDLTSLKLVDTSRFESGIVVLVYSHP